MLSFNDSYEICIKIGLGVIPLSSDNAIYDTRDISKTGKCKFIYRKV